MLPEVERSSRLSTRDLCAAITRAKRRRDEYELQGEWLLAEQANKAMDRMLEVLGARYPT